MNMKDVEQLKDFTLWAKKVTGKTVNFDIKFWAYSHEDAPKTEFSLWIEDLFHYTTKDIRALISLLPYLNVLCNENRLPTEPRRIAA